MIGLSLSGGGAKGAFEAGVIEYLAAHATDPAVDLPNGFDVGVGCSVGALGMGALAHHASGPSQLAGFSTRLTRCWESIRTTKDVWTLRFPPYVSGAYKPSLGDNAPLKKLLDRQIEWEIVTAAKMPVEVAAYNLCAARTEYLAVPGTKAAFISALCASSSFPLAFPPELVGADLYTDGGIGDIAPTARLIRKGCTRIIAVVLRNPDKPELKKASDFKSVFDVGRACLDGMESEIVRGDLEQVVLVNRLIAAGAAPGKRTITLDVILPDSSLGDPLDFSPALTTARRKAGWTAAERFFTSAARPRS
jgi:NTE family protein